MGHPFAGDARIGVQFRRAGLKQVRPLMEKCLSEMDVPVEIYEPLANDEKRSHRHRILSRKKRPAFIRQRALF